MKFVSFQTKQDGVARWGIVQEEQIFSYGEKSSSINPDFRAHHEVDQTTFPSLLAFIQAGEKAFSSFEQDLQGGRLVACNVEEVIIKAPFRPLKNIVCVGKNYADHVLEMSRQNPAAIPEYPVFFTKPPTSVIGPGEEINAFGYVTEQLDYEGELAVVIGRSGRDIAAEDALDHVFGYTILNDVTARDLQKRHGQFYKGKSLDTFAPFGPCIVHRSAVSDLSAISIRTYVNDEERQNGSVSDMIFSVPQLIASLSNGMTLEAGDVIATGTPSGVGKGFDPPRLLQAGDEVRIEIDGIGKLVNRVVS